MKYEALAPPRLTLRWAIIVSLAFGVLHAPVLMEKYEPNTWLERDGSFYFTTLRAIADHGRIEQRFLQPESWYTRDLGWNRELPEDWSNVALGSRGGWYPKHSILLPILTVPLYWLFGALGALIVNCGLNLLFVLLTFLICRRFARVEIAAAVAILFSTQPFVKLMTYGYSNDLLGADLALASVEAVLGEWFATAGVLAGFCIWSRLTNAAIIPGLLLIGWDAGGRRGVVRATLAALVPLGIFGLYNTWAFGAPWVTSYQRVLVRDHGEMQVASHVKAFNVPWKRGIHRVIYEPDGVFQTFPLLAPGLAGFLVLAWRRTLLTLGLILYCVLPTLAVTTYDWYRPHFLLAVFGSSAIGIATMLGALIPATPAIDPLPVRPIIRQALKWSAVAALIAIIGFHIVHRPNQMLLSSHIAEAKVYLDDIPCDYWNPQRDRWECSHLDPELWAMTGAILGPPKEPGIFLPPSPTRKWRRIVFPDLPGNMVDLDFEFSKRDSRPGTVQIQVLPHGHDQVDLTLGRPGETARKGVWFLDGPDPLEIRVRADDPQRKPLIVEGTINQGG